SSERANSRNAAESANFSRTRWRISNSLSRSSERDLCQKTASPSPMARKPSATAAATSPYHWMSIPCSLREAWGGLAVETGRAGGGLTGSTGLSRFCRWTRGGMCLQCGGRDRRGDGLQRNGGVFLEHDEPARYEPEAAMCSLSREVFRVRCLLG